MKKVTQLTQEQLDLLPKWRDMGIKIGFATGDGTVNVEEVIRLTNAHRKMHGVPEAKYFVVAKSPTEAILKCRDKGINANNALYGNQDIHWLNYYNFFRVELSLTEETEPVKHLIELTKHVGWMWMSTEATIVCPLPTAIRSIPGTFNGVEVQLHPTEPGKYVNKDITFTAPLLHSFDNFAIEYGDGTGSYSIFGTRIPANYDWIIKTPADQLKAADILAIRDADIKAAAIKKIGFDKMWDSLNKNQLGKKTLPSGGTYVLWDVLLPGEQERDKFLQMECPSKKDVHVHMMDPRCKTVDQALAFFMPWGAGGIKLTDEQIFRDDTIYIEPKVQS